MGKRGPAIPNPVVLDFETKGIQPRPLFPPTAAGFSLLMPGERKANYYAWGHKGGGNNCTKADAARVLRGVYKSGHSILFHNGKFDQEVAQNEFDLAPLTWERFHDTLFLTFLWNPRLWSMKLKDVAVELLGESVEERDDLRDWIIANVPEAKRKPKQWGAYIWLAPAPLAGRYANMDTRLTLKLFRHLYPLIAEEGMLDAYERERRLMPILMRMEQRGINLDKPGLERDLAEWKRVEQALGQSILRKLKVPKREWDNWHKEEDDKGNYPEGYTFGGNTLADQLERAGKVQAFVLTEKGNRSTSAENLAEACSDKALAKELEVHAQIKNCISTFAVPWLYTASMGRHEKIYTNFNQVRSPEGGAGTGRLSSYPNLQNIIRGDKDPRVPQLRNYIVPGKEGRKQRVMVARDYSQQELRILAHFEEGNLFNRYQDDPNTDAHTAVSEMITEVTGQTLPRSQIKILNFMQVYGGGERAVAYKLKCDHDTARHLRNLHKKALPGVQSLQRQIKQLVAAGEPIVTWGGRVYYVEEPAMIGGRLRTFEYKLLNYLIQGSAADCTKQAMINYADIVGDRWDEAPLELQIHDELLGSTTGDPKRMHKELAEAMAAVEFSIPMLSDGKSSRKSWGEMEKV